jgi:hypothetical protein
MPIRRKFRTSPKLTLEEMESLGQRYAFALSQLKKARTEKERRFWRKTLRVLEQAMKKR